MADDCLAVASIQVSPLDDMVLGIHPVHAAAGIVDGEAVGPEQVCVCNDPPVGAVHIGVLNARCVAPVCPVDLTEEESGTIIVTLIPCFPEVKRLLSGLETQQMCDVTKSLLCARHSCRPHHHSSVLTSLRGKSYFFGGYFSIIPCK